MHTRKCLLKIYLFLFMLLSCCNHLTAASTWTELSPTNFPSARDFAAVASNPITDQTILFGGREPGTAAEPFNDTWNWNGNNWVQLNPAISPSGKVAAAIGFDPVSGNLIMFGGTHGNTIDNETWSWDGTNWTQLSPSNSPQALYGSSIANDPITGQLILFGGNSTNNGATNETWRWDGSNWIQLDPSDSPSPRYGSLMAFDPVGNQIILFGGEDFPNSQVFDDTWSWNGNNWTELNPANSPPPTSNTSIAYDSTSQQLIFFGGSDFLNTNPYDNTWAWNGSNWNQLNLDPDIFPPPRSANNLFSNSVTGQLFLFGGGEGNGGLDSGFLSFSDTWIWGTSCNVSRTWQQLTPADSPPARQLASLSTALFRLPSFILFGGYNNNSDIIYGDTWSWAGNNWEQLSPQNSPSARYNASMSTDNSGEIVLFGGITAGGESNETWVWIGDWVQILVNGPSARSGAAMALDEASQEVILFGGTNGSNETWEWFVDPIGGSRTWTQLNPANSPSGRQDAAMAYNPLSEQIILFGGLTNSGDANDTWAWTGSNWTQLNPANSPPARQNASLVYEPALQMVILFGGFNADTQEVFNDTWGWNGDNWIELNPATSPQDRSGASLVSSSAVGGQTILFGGYNNQTNQILGDTWNFVINPSAPTITNISPNSGPAGTVVTITGTNFSPGCPMQVYFGNNPGTNVTVISPTELVVIVPSGAGVVDVVVTTSTGSSSISPEAVFNYVSSVVTITSQNNPANVGQPVILTATVTGGTGTPTGTVTFLLGNSQQVTVPLINGQATLQTSLLPPGNNIIFAVYSGDQTHPAAVSNPFTQVVIGVAPPRRPFVVQINNKCECGPRINIIGWEAPRRGITPVAYTIYRDADLRTEVATVLASSETSSGEFIYKDRGRRVNRIYTYYIVSVDEFGNQSRPVKVVYYPV